MRMRDLASALAAGVPLAIALPRFTADAGTIVAALEREPVQLSRTERCVLQAAEKSGRLAEALPERAAARELRASLVLQLAGRLIYPVFLIAAAVTVDVLLGVITGRSWGGTLLTIGILVAVVGLGAMGLCLRLRRAQLENIPVLGGLLQDLAELPYLQALLGLYAAGVLLPEAQAEAARACPLAGPRVQLVGAASLVQAGQPLASALQSAGAVSAESWSILASGERAGDLEGALRRLVQRRTETLTLRARRLVGLATGLATLVAFAIAIRVIVGFWAQYYGALGGSLR